MDDRIARYLRSLVAALALLCFALPTHAQERERTEPTVGSYADGYRDGHLAGYDQGYREGFDKSQQIAAEEISDLERQIEALEASNDRLRAEIARLTRGDDDDDDPDDPDDPRDPTRGSRDARPTDLEDKTGYGSGWGTWGDAIYLTPTHDLIADTQNGVHEMIHLEGVRLRPGYRSGIHSTMGDTSNRYRLWFTDSELLPDQPNGPAQNWAGQGTLWGGRAYGIHSGLIDNVWIEDWFGDAYADNEFTSREGHGFYFTFAQTPGAVFTFSDLSFDNLGGHALHIATASGDRTGNAPYPQRGGEIIIDHCDFLNTDRCQARGAYAVSMTNAFAAVTISNSNIVQDHLVSKNGSFDGGYRSRALVHANGNQESLTLVNNYLEAAEPSDRTFQVSVEGPDLVVMEGNTFNCQEISINDPYGDKPGTIKTQRFVFRNNEGTARVKWNGKVLGLAGEVSGDWQLQ